MRRGKAVYWARTTRNGARWNYAEPVEISVRWEDVTELHESETGEKWMSSATVYVDRDMNMGDYIYNGVLTDITDSTIPRNNTGSREVKKFSKLPTLRYNEYLLTVYL